MKSQIKDLTLYILPIFLFWMVSHLLCPIVLADNIKPRSLAPNIGFNGSLDLAQPVQVKEEEYDKKFVNLNTDVDIKAIEALKEKLNSLTKNSSNVNETDLLIFDHMEGSTKVKDIEKGVNLFRENLRDMNFNNTPVAIISELQKSMSQEEYQVLEHLNILWQSAVERSETIRFAIQKLSGADQKEGKDKNKIKSTLTSVTSMLPVLGVMSGSDLAAGSGIMGGNFLGSIFSDDEKKVNGYLSRVSDADLVLLAKEIDALQKNVIEKYYDYRHAIERLQLTQQIVHNRYKEYNSVSSSHDRQLIAIADSFYKEALQSEYDAKQEVLSTRASLEQLTGYESVLHLDSQLMSHNS